MISRKYESGQYVVYSTNGLCHIEAIKDMCFVQGTEEKPHYILKPVSGGASLIYIPADNEKLMSKVRPVMTKADIDALLSNVKERNIEWEEDRKLRADRFHDILTSGVDEDLLLMISCIYLKKHELTELNRKLSVSDAKFLENAEKLVKEEFSFALSTQPADVGAYIRQALGI